MFSLEKILYVTYLLKWHMLVHWYMLIKETPVELSQHHHKVAKLH